MSKISEAIESSKKKTKKPVFDDDKAEQAAMKLFERAKSPEEKVSALKEFVKLVH